MNVNAIAADRSSASQTASAQSGGESFQLAYAKVYDGRYAPPAPLTPGLAVDTAPSISTPPPAARPAAAAAAAHTVHSGDTLSRIARARLAGMGVTADAVTLRQSVAQLAKANNIRNPDRIYTGQKIELAALDAGFSGKPVAAAAANAVSARRDVDNALPGSARTASGVEVTAHPSWQPDDMLPPGDAQYVAAAPAQLPPATPAFPPAALFGAVEPQIAAMPPIPSVAARQVAAYEQNAVGATDKAADPSRGVPDIVYKGVAGKVLDALPIEPSTRANLQRANTIVSSAFTARSLGALTGIGGPILTVAGLLWGIFSSRQIEAAPTTEAKAMPEPNPVVDAKQPVPTKVADALK